LTAIAYPALSPADAGALPRSVDHPMRSSSGASKATSTPRSAGPSARAAANTPRPPSAASTNRAANDCVSDNRPRAFPRKIARTTASPEAGARSIPATVKVADPKGGSAASQDRGSDASFWATVRVARASVAGTSGQERRSKGAAVNVRPASCRPIRLAAPNRGRGRCRHDRRRRCRSPAASERPRTRARSLCRAAEA
jgi:hypothetical protein